MIRIFNQYVSAKTLLLVFLESGLIALSLLAAIRLRFWNNAEAFQTYTQLPDFGIQALVVIVVFEICFYYTDLYNPAAIRRRYERLICVGEAAGAACLVLSLVYYIFPNLLIGRGVLFIAVGLIVATVLTGRIILDRTWQMTALRERVLILGSRDTAVTVVQELARRNDLSLELAGFVSETPDAGDSLIGYPILGCPADLESIVNRHKIRRVVVALENRRGLLPVRELVKIRVRGIRVEDAHSLIASLTGRVWLHAVKPSWFVFSDGFHRSQLNLIFKRLFDVGVGTIGLLVTSPVMILVALAIRLESKGPIIYRQTRVGLGGGTFDVLKFRSMRQDAEQGDRAQWAQQDDPRVTRLGKWIRKFRIDEFPQFINVIRGDMSFVGPRPERPVFVEQLREQIAYYDERHSVRPGITGWAQVQYPYGSSIEDAFRKLEYDLFYLQNMSLRFDCAIIFQTLRTVVTGKGAR